MQRHMPLGYRIVEGRAEIVPEAAQIVKAVFQEYLNGVSTYQIARNLTAQGVLNASHRPSWNHGSIGKMLENTKYTGDDFYPALIDKERFERVQARRMKRAESLGRTAQLNSFANKTPISGQLFCGVCGEPYRRYVEHSGQSGQTVKWKCKHYIWKNRVSCRNIFLTNTQIEDTFVEMVNQLIANPVLLKQNPPVRQTVCSPTGERLTSQIEQALKTGGYTADEIRRMAFERAAEKYRVSKVNDWQYQTEKLEAALRGKAEQATFDNELFTEVVRRATVHKDGKIKFECINGLVLMRNITEKKKEEHT